MTKFEFRILNKLFKIFQNGMIAAIVYSTQNRVEFDSCWLESVQENILFKVKYL